MGHVRKVTLPWHRRRAPTGLLMLMGLIAASCHAGYRMEPVDRPAVDPWEAPPGLATVCVLRVQRFGVAARVLHTDNDYVVGLTEGTNVYFCYHVEPGVHRIVATTDNDAVIDADIPAGARFFLGVHLRMGEDALDVLTEAQAQALIPRLTYVVARAGEGVTPVLDRPVPAASGE